MQQPPENQEIMSTHYDLTVRVLFFEGEERIIRGGRKGRYKPEKKSLMRGFSRKVVMRARKWLAFNGFHHYDLKIVCRKGRKTL